MVGFSSVGFTVIALCKFAEWLIKYTKGIAMTITPKKIPPDINYVTPDQFPNDYEIWGDEGFERINNLLDKAVHLVGRKSKNEVMHYAGLSKNKSKDGKKPVVFIDCDSLNRYHVDERHIKAGKLPKPDRASVFK